MDKEAAKKAISELVEKYKRLEADGRLTQYNEEMTKNEFIEPLFEALGWDVRNRKVYDEVIKEHGVLRGRVDYALRLNGVDRLFIEAKAFKADMDNNAWAKQVIEYGYNKGVSFVILTNFEILRVFNSEWNEPNIYRCIVLDLKYTDYLDKFDELSCLSREATVQNLLVEKANAQGKRNPRKSVQELLSEQLILWRERLAKNIKSNYGNNYSKETVDEIVQKFIDRLIFIRTCEERNLEDKKLLENVNQFTKSNKRLWNLVKEVYVYYRKEYDSNLFGKDDADLHELDRIDINDNVVYEIINSTYKKDDFDVSYNFGDIDADVLGSAYEQYLGHLLKTTAKGAKTEDGHAHRKEQGIYYTPRYIVDYIVRNTIGEKIKDMKPEEVEKLRILDPACGSGSFLIRAFDEIHNYYLLKEKNRQIKLGEESDLKQKTRILKNNIYGVDLDGKAVEIAQLNLMLKAAEKRHRLPLLQDNIKHGNSLIDDPSIAGTHAFRWEEKFADIMKNGGFDVVIGNPPYINALQLSKTTSAETKAYWKEKYQAAKGTYDIYILFFEQALKVCKEGGFVSFITPNKYLSSPYGAALREMIAKDFRLVKVLDLSEVDVFGDPSVYPIITIIQKKKPTREYTILTEKIFSSNLDDKKTYKVSSRNLTSLPEYIWGVILSNNLSIIEKIFSGSKPLGEVAEVQATSTAAEADEFSKYIGESQTGMMIINTGTIDRYATTYGLTKFTNKGEKLLKPMLAMPKIPEGRTRLYKSPKLIFSKIALRIEAFLDVDGEYASINTNCVHSQKIDYPLKYLAGILNSKLLSFVYSEIFSGLRMSGGYYQFQAPQMRILPIAAATKEQQDRMNKLVDVMSSLCKRLAEFGDQQTNARRDLDEEIKKIDAQIDELVYKIYGLNKDDIEIVKESLKQ